MFININAININVIVPRSSIAWLQVHHTLTWPALVFYYLKLDKYKYMILTW